MSKVGLHVGQQGSIDIARCKVPGIGRNDGSVGIQVLRTRNARPLSSRPCNKTGIPESGIGHRYGTAIHAELFGYIADGRKFVTGADPARSYSLRDAGRGFSCRPRSEEHTSELQSLMRNSYAVFCLKKKKSYTKHRI